LLIRPSQLGELILQTGPAQPRRGSAVTEDEDLTADSFALLPAHGEDDQRPSTPIPDDAATEKPVRSPLSLVGGASDAGGAPDGTPNILQIRHADSLDLDGEDAERERLAGGDPEAGDTSLTSEPGIADSAGVILGCVRPRACRWKGS
jgi:hypothetical protein